MHIGSGKDMIADQRASIDESCRMNGRRLVEAPNFLQQAVQAVNGTDDTIFRIVGNLFGIAGSFCGRPFECSSILVYAMEANLSRSSRLTTDSRNV